VAFVAGYFASAETVTAAFHVSPVWAGLIAGACGVVAGAYWRSVRPNALQRKRLP
jgi:hypothetical protein